MPSTSDAMFEREEQHGLEGFRPLAGAASQWAGAGTVRGLASSALLARFAERAIEPSNGLRPVRWTADLSRPVAMRPVTARAQVVRAGRRLRLVDAEMLQDDRVVARGRGLFLASGDGSSGEVWAPHHTAAVPPSTLRPDTREARLYYSEDVGWSSSATAHNNKSRKQLWCYPFAVIGGERATQFQLAAGFADLASVVSNWGSNGIEFINADVTLSLARLPRGQELGISALDRMTDDAIAIGSALVHDREGVVGMATVSALASATGAVDPGLRDAGIRRADPT